LAAGSEGLIVSFLLFRLSFELSDHNRQRAASMPMMVGMMVVPMGVPINCEVHLNLVT